LTDGEFGEMFAGFSLGPEGPAARGREGARGLRLSCWTAASSPE